MKVALIQMSSTKNRDANIAKARQMIQEAAADGAGLICLPEVFIGRGLRPTGKAAPSIAENVPGPTTKMFCDLARACRSDILLGSLYEKTEMSGKMYNTSVLVSRAGRVLAKYRKRHLFQARVAKRTVDETKVFLPGARGRTVKRQGFRFGLAVCYDVRFPSLFRQYARQGCDAFFVPSNFTRRTGSAHWEVLLRARAVENLCYVLAPNQVGAVKGGVRAYGNSMVVDPWGRVLVRASGNKEQVVYAQLSKLAIREARKALPGFNIALLEKG